MLDPADRTRELLTQVGAGGEGRDVAREALVHLHRPLVEHCALRFAGRGEPYDDLVQVGMVGLLQAIDRFDPDRGRDFTSFAVPTVLGEVRRWFRDKGWAVHVPRGLQELRARTTATSAHLAHELGRSPTAAELAAALGCSVEDVVDGLESAGAYASVSLDAGADDPDGPYARLATLGADDPALARVELRESVRPLLEQLPAREKRILLLRYFVGHTQSQVAAEVGLSQMQVSRLLASTLEDLRAALGDAPVRSSFRPRAPTAPPRPGARRPAP